MRTSDQIDKISPALLEAQKSMGKLVKDRQNEFLKTGYATLEAVLETIRPVFHASGIAIVQGCEPLEGGVLVITRLNHDSGQWIETHCPIMSAKKDAQSTGSAITYGRRYGLKAVSGLSEEDDDGNGGSDVKPNRRKDKAAHLPSKKNQRDEIGDLFKALEATDNQIIATCRKYSDNRVDNIDGLLEEECRQLIPVLQKKLEEKSPA